jgi:hypothetical protein
VIQDHLKVCREVLVFLLMLLELLDSFLGTRVEKSPWWYRPDGDVTFDLRARSATMLHRDVTLIGALEACLSGRQARKSVSINFPTFTDGAGVTAKIDGMACPSPKAVKIRLCESRIVSRAAGSRAPFCVAVGVLSILATIKISQRSIWLVLCQ